MEINHSLYSFYSFYAILLNILALLNILKIRITPIVNLVEERFSYYLYTVSDKDITNAKGITVYE